MIYVALAALLVALVSVYASLSVIRAISRAHDRRVDVLLDRLAHASHNPWTPAPASAPEPEPEGLEYSRGEQEPTF